jgi:Plavaka transposase
MDIEPHPLPVLTPSESGTTNSNTLPLTPTSPEPDFDMIDLEDLSSRAPPDVPHFTQSGRPRREYRLPQRFRDNLPEPTPAPILELQESNLRRRVLLIVRDRFITASNSFGIWRDYPDRPTADPDALLTLKDLSNRQHLAIPEQSVGNPITSLASESSSQLTHWPFPNPTIHAVMQWLNNGKTAKSELEVTNFVQKVILAPTFNCRDLIGFDAHRENQHLDKMLTEEPKLRSQFMECSVEILVPSGKPHVEAVSYRIPGLLYRKLKHVILDALAFNGPLAHLLHYPPFKTFVTLMLSSNATHLTDFGNAKAWPIYLMLGSLSKYIRSQPNSGAMHHLAYIPSPSVCLYFS